MPESLLEQLAPDPGKNLEDLSEDYAFDQLRAARILAALVLEPLLDPDRAERLIAFSDRNAQMPSLPEVIDIVAAGPNFNGWLVLEEESDIAAADPAAAVKANRETLRCHVA